MWDQNKWRWSGRGTSSDGTTTSGTGAVILSGGEQIGHLGTNWGRDIRIRGGRLLIPILDG